MLHEGMLRIEGDADSELVFYDGGGGRIEIETTSQGGTALGTNVGAEPRTLLEVMGKRGGWSVDALVEASGLETAMVQMALVELELGGCVQSDSFGYGPLSAAV
jgi:hypothetical protein